MNAFRIGLPLLFYALLSVLEPQREIWRKPTKNVLVVFLIAWGAVVCFIALAFVPNKSAMIDGQRSLAERLSSIYLSLATFSAETDTDRFVM